ncbi:MAG: TetR family transcriptional regulator [Steroidobacteraceae bacterium]
MAIDNEDSRYRNTRERILAAARAELISYGFAGARINRIATSAGTSKERIYAYFRDKEELLDTVTQDRMLSQEQEVHFDASDLLSYVGTLYDFYVSHPDDIRISHWIGLEAVNATLPDNNARVKMLKQRVAATLSAQQSGLIDPSWHPLTLISLLVSIARSWATAPLYARTLSTPSVSPASLSSNRAAALEAARRLLTPPRKLRG